MKPTQTAEQAVAMANAYFKGRCTAKVTDGGNAVTFEFEDAQSRTAAGDQVFDVDRFKRLLKNLDDALQRHADADKSP
jgi:hypothetical protein